MADTQTITIEAKAASRDEAAKAIVAEATSRGHEVLAYDGPYESDSGSWSSEVLVLGGSASKAAPKKKAAKKKAAKKDEPEGEKKSSWVDKLKGKK